MSRRLSGPNMRDMGASGTDQGRFDLATIVPAELPLVRFAGSDVRRGRPSVAEAEAMSGRILNASWGGAAGRRLRTFYDRPRRAACAYRQSDDLFALPRQRRTDACVAGAPNRNAQRLFKSAGSDLAIEDAFRQRAAKTIKACFPPTAL